MTATCGTAAALGRSGDRRPDMVRLDLRTRGSMHGAADEPVTSGAAAGMPGWVRANAPLLAATAAVLLAVVAAGLAVRFGLGRSLGSALSPFVMGYKPALAVADGGGGRRARRRRWWPPRRRLLTVAAPAFAAALFAAALGLGLAVNAGRGGAGGVERDLPPRRRRLVRGDQRVPARACPRCRYGTPFFLDRFAELVPALPINVSGHPPGLHASLLAPHGH